MGGEAKSLTDRIKGLYRQYGRVGIATYLAISTSSFLTLYCLVERGVNVGGLLERVGIERHGKEGEGGSDGIRKSGALVVALGINKLLFPVRLGTTVWMTPKVSRMIERIKTRF